MSFNVVEMPPQPQGAANARQSELARLVEALNVELAGEKIDLPSFPDVATRVRRALTNDQVDVDAVVRIVSAEPALAARLLQLANSAALNPGGKRFTDLRSAISRIGFNMARSAAIAFAMSQLRRAEAYKSVGEELAELWKQSAHVAAMCHVVARRFTQINADTALLAGLLQGVGKLYLLTRAARFPALLADAGTYQRLVAEWHLPLATGHPAQLGAVRRDHRRRDRLREPGSRSPGRHRSRRCAHHLRCPGAARSRPARPTTCCSSACPPRAA